MACRGRVRRPVADSGGVVPVHVGEKVVSDPDMWERIREALAEVFTPEGVDIWMAAEHRQFGGWTVTEMVNHNRGDEVLAAIDRLASGAFG